MEQAQKSGEAFLNINNLAMKAAYFALKSFAKNYQMANGHVVSNQITILLFKSTLITGETPTLINGETKPVGMSNLAQQL